ncbi:hypothetical protein BKA70DRAFT_1554216 [Coprinopsis sp. MPI-PUGE-AT-0042]|nr:hypothetical protein BKA70DRAFT_1554216 [Coprinopsis sp. MPI-PUGE-AT-0042]
MAFVSALATSIVAFLAVASAAPSLLSEPGSIASQCTNVRFYQGWLIGDCLTGSGTTRITSGTYLNSKLGNDDGALVWSVDGTFGQSCYDCTFTDGAFACKCWRAWPNSGQERLATVDLDKYIGVYTGHILSNLTGPPQIPSKPSPYPFPSDLTYYLGGNATCSEYPSNEVPDWCTQVNPNCVDGNGTQFSNLPIDHHYPLSKCYVPTVYFSWYYFQYSQLKIVGEGAWELTVYSDQECTKKIGIISAPDEAGVCKSFGTEKVRGITTRPLFNGDAV